MEIVFTSKVSPSDLLTLCSLLPKHVLRYCVHLALQCQRCLVMWQERQIKCPVCSVLAVGRGAALWVVFMQVVLVSLSRIMPSWTMGSSCMGHSRYQRSPWSGDWHLGDNVSVAYNFWRRSIDKVPSVNLIALWDQETGRETEQGMYQQLLDTFPSLKEQKTKPWAVASIYIFYSYLTIIIQWSSFCTSYLSVLCAGEQRRACLVTEAAYSFLSCSGGVWQKAPVDTGPGISVAIFLHGNSPVYLALARAL